MLRSLQNYNGSVGRTKTDANSFYFYESVSKHKLLTSAVTTNCFSSHKPAKASLNLYLWFFLIPAGRTHPRQSSVLIQWMSG